MKKNTIFDRVYLTQPIKQAVFDMYLEGVCAEIVGCYGQRYTATEGEIPLLDAYEEAVVQGILYRLTSQPCYEAAYRAAAERAYRAVWRENVRTNRKET